VAACYLLASVLERREAMRAAAIGASAPGGVPGIL
jgi:hypothetical protein